MKAGTAKVYQPAIRRARDRFAGRRMKEIQPWEIKAWLVELGFAHTTTSNHKAVVNAIYQLYIDSPQWHGDYNPARMVSMPRGLARSRRQPPAEDQVEIVRRAAQTPDTDALLAVLTSAPGSAGERPVPSLWGILTGRRGRSASPKRCSGSITSLS